MTNFCSLPGFWAVPMRRDKKSQAISKLRLSTRTLTRVLANRPRPENNRWRIQLSLAMIELAKAYDAYADVLLEELEQSGRLSQDAARRLSGAFGEN